MSEPWQIIHASDHTGKNPMVVTSHVPADGFGRLAVTHRGGRRPFFAVRIEPRSVAALQRRLWWSPHLAATATLESGSPPQRSVAAPPSEAIRSLIAAHADDPHSWPVLLDALQEHYPELWDACERHRADRHATDAVQYAAAFSEASRRD